MIRGTGVRECQRRGRPPVPEWMQRSGEGARQSASREPRLDRRGAQDVGPALSPRARCECLSGRASDDRNGRSPSVFADDRLRLASVGIAGADVVLRYDRVSSISKASVSTIDALAPVSMQAPRRTRRGCRDRDRVRQSGSTPAAGDTAQVSCFRSWARIGSCRCRRADHTRRAGWTPACSWIAGSRWFFDRRFADVASESWSIPAVELAAGVARLAEQPAEQSRPVSLGLAGSARSVPAQVAVEPVGAVQEAVVHRGEQVGDQAGHAAGERPAVEFDVVDRDHPLGLPGAVGAVSAEHVAVLSGVARAMSVWRDRRCWYARSSTAAR